MVDLASQATCEQNAATCRERFQQARALSKLLCEPLEAEDCVVQSMPDVSPTRWHLAHTTWFFETFVLQASESSYQPVSEVYRFLFNSYYNSVGDPYPRSQRGLLSRPTVREVWDYRHAIDERMDRFFKNSPAPQLLEVVELGIHHEQQHQELMLTDIKHVFSSNPIYPVYRQVDTTDGDLQLSPAKPMSHEGGIVRIGFDGPGFAYDNELPRHDVFLQDFVINDRLVTSREFLDFICDGGYETPTLWLSEGWAAVQSQNWKSPLYWHKRDGEWWEFTLLGLRPVVLDVPVCHVSYFEADAFARWSGRRLPTEFEWEHAAAAVPIQGNFVDDQRWHPQPSSDAKAAPSQLWGDVWEWTSSAYAAYPGYRANEGALGEYNGKFMCNQFVLRGGSCATSSNHIRPTYRNFFPPHARWQFTGLRLAE